MIKYIDQLLNRVTLYRLTLYLLIGLVLLASVLSFFHLVSFTPMQIVVSATVILLISIWTNKIFANYFEISTRKESTLITALILVLILSPGYSFREIVVFIIAATLAVASKFLLAPFKKHIFNPAAISVIFTAIVLSQYASWWVGTAVMLPLVILGGILIVRKMRRGDEVLIFMATVLTLLIIAFVFRGKSMPQVYIILKSIFVSSAFLFFTFIMFTEPLTSPFKKQLQYVFAIIVAILYVTPQLRLFGISLTPEFALAFGNIFSYIASYRRKSSLVTKTNSGSVSTSSVQAV